MGTSASRGAHPNLPRLKEAEARLLQSLTAKFTQRDILIKHDGVDVTLHSVEATPGSDTGAPLVFLPGYGTGAAIFAGCWLELLGRDADAVSRLPLISLDCP